MMGGVRDAPCRPGGVTMTSTEEDHQSLLDYVEMETSQRNGPNNTDATGMEHREDRNCGRSK